VNTVASKFAKVYGKRGVLVVIAVIAALVSARTGWGIDHAEPLGFFDGG